MAQVAGESPDWQSDGVLHFFHESIGTEEPINAQNAKRLARTVLPEERYSYLDPDEEDGRRGREKAPGFHNWMKSEGRWQYRLGKGWKHKKHLGTGGFGIAGLWEYEGYEGDDDNEWEKQIRHIVVKQTRMGQDLGLRQEGRYMALLNQTGSRHFPKLYQRVFREPGAGSTALPLDSSLREVNRIFMEFCEGGDMGKVVQKQKNRWTADSKNWLSEDKVWAVFVCLAKAAMAMARGTEDPNAEGWGETRRPLIHFDLKPENIFLGTKDREEHVVMPIFKVGDLGLMEESESATAVYSTEYFQNHIMLGTPCILAPEQTRLSHLVVTNRSGVENRIPNVQLEKRYRRFGSLTNVYQVGAAIWCLATLSGWFDVWGRTYISQLSANLMKGDTIGEDLERGIFNPSIIRRYRFSGIDGREDQTRYQVPYSNALKTLVLECLMQRPAHRPSAEELLARATVGYSLAREACKDAEGTDADDFVTTEPTSRVATPAHWRQMDRLDEWPLAPQDADFDSLFSMAIFKPLDEVLDRRLRHLKRYIQVWDARTFVGGYDLDVATALKIVEAKTKAKRQERYLRRMRHEPRPLVVAVVAVTLCAHLSGPPQRKQLRWARHKTVASLKINAKLHWLDLCEVPDMRIADADALPGTPSYDWDDACTMMDLGPGGPDDKGELTKELHVWMRDGAGFRFPPMYSTPSPSPPRPPPPPETTAEARAEPNEPAEKLGAQTSARVDPATNDDAATAAAAASTPRAEGIPRKRRRDGSVLTEGSPQAKKKKKKRDEV